MPQGPASFDPDPGHFPPVERAPPLQLLVEALAVDHLHGVEEEPFLFAEPEQAHDVRVAQLLEGLDLGLEPVAKIGTPRHRGREDLQRGRLVGLHVHRPVDGPHAAVTQRADDSIGPQSFRFHHMLPG